MKTKDREEFISLLAQERIPLTVARAFLRAGASLQRLAELSCSSEAADRDRVKCPAAKLATDPDTCLCRDYGSFDRTAVRVSALRGTVADPHGMIPRITVQEARLVARVEKLAQANGLGVLFGGDPRGAVLLVTLPSGRSNDWAGRGVVAG